MIVCVSRHHCCGCAGADESGVARGRVAQQPAAAGTAAAARSMPRAPGLVAGSTAAAGLAAYLPVTSARVMLAGRPSAASADERCSTSAGSLALRGVGAEVSAGRGRARDARRGYTHSVVDAVVSTATFAMPSARGERAMETRPSGASSLSADTGAGAAAAGEAAPSDEAASASFADMRRACARTSVEGIAARSSTDGAFSDALPDMRRACVSTSVSETGTAGAGFTRPSSLLSICAYASRSNATVSRFRATGNAGRRCCACFHDRVDDRGFTVVVLRGAKSQNS